MLDVIQDSILPNPITAVFAHTILLIVLNAIIISSPNLTVIYAIPATDSMEQDNASRVLTILSSASANQIKSSTLIQDSVSLVNRSSLDASPVPKLTV